MITYQKAQTIPEYRMASTIDVPLAVVAKNHWNILKDPVFLACLTGFRERHEASKRTTPGAGLPTKGITLTTTLPSATSFSSQTAPTSEADEVKEQVHEILGQIFTLRVETVQEMGFIWETDHALARALILVIVDHFTRYTRAYVVKDQKVSTAARILYEGIY